MDSDVVIKVDNLSKKFCRSIKRSMLYGSMDVARSMLGLSTDRTKLRKHEFWALKDIDFEIGRGETFGLVGANGCGKSTLLRMINGIFPPDVGSISVKGRIGALIAVGAGFHPHMTGRENIFLNGTVLGMTKEEIADKMDDIIAFAEIGEFLDAPVSTYSSGMYVRLGFAIAIHSNPDIVLVDEILAVGDSKFQRKCLEKIREMRKKGTTFILVSHNMQNIEAMCNRVVLIDKGKQIALGAPREIIPTYELMLQTGNVGDVVSDTQPTKGLTRIFKYSDFGTDEVKVDSVTLLAEGKETVEIDSLKEFTLEIEVISEVEEDDAILYLTFNYVVDREDDLKNYVSYGAYERLSLQKGKSRISIKLSDAALTTGEYKMGLFLFDKTYTNPYTQGYYGYFTCKYPAATMLRVGMGTPFLWSRNKVNIERID